MNHFEGTLAVDKGKPFAKVLCRAREQSLSLAPRSTRRKARTGLFFELTGPLTMLVSTPRAYPPNPPLLPPLHTLVEGRARERKRFITGSWAGLPSPIFRGHSGVITGSHYGVSYHFLNSGDTGQFSLLNSGVKGVGKGRRGHHTGQSSNRVSNGGRRDLGEGQADKRKAESRRRRRRLDFGEGGGGSHPRWHGTL